MITQCPIKAKKEAQQLEIIQKNRMTWALIDDEHIQVTFYGMSDEACAKVEADMFKAGAYAVRRRYDKKLKQTVTIYKRG